MLKRVVLLGALASAPAHAVVCGKASYYNKGHTTASGEKFDPKGLTVAHKSLPFGTKLDLCYNDKKITVRVNDRGPFVKNRILDLSEGAAKALGIKERGVDHVCYITEAERE